MVYRSILFTVGAFIVMCVLFSILTNGASHVHVYTVMNVHNCTVVIIMLLHLCTSVQLLGYLYALHTLMHCVNAKASWIHYTCTVQITRNLYASFLHS